MRAFRPLARGATRDGREHGRAALTYRVGITTARDDVTRDFMLTAPGRSLVHKYDIGVNFAA